MHITVLYDNKSSKPDVESGWGFSCLISGGEKRILFDTGPGGSLLDNMEKLKIETNSIDTVVLSHIHPDHTGGLEIFLAENPEVTVYLPGSFPAKFKYKVRDHEAKTVEIEGPMKICTNIHSTGQIGKRIKEQALIIRTESGLIVITGCAHPGIVNVVNAAKDLVKEDILLVIGGFHLEWTRKRKIENIISSFKGLGVKKAGPCHCTGDKARSLFEEYFGCNYIDVGAGKEIILSDL